MTLPTISYLIFTHNEGTQYIDFLLSTILKNKKSTDELVVIDDFSDDVSTVQTLEKYKKDIIFHQHALNNDFSTHKNFGKDKCTKDFIFQIDADEAVSPQFFGLIEEIIINNQSVDLYWLPRMNIVNGLTKEDINKWGWNMTDFNNVQLVQWPDYQGRIWRNTPNIKWDGKVHEKIVGQKNHTLLPAFDSDGNPVTDYAILHIKDIDRQRKQNEFYEKTFG